MRCDETRRGGKEKEKGKKRETKKWGGLEKKREEKK